MRTITIDECTKIIRVALKQGWPLTKFSVRKTRSTYDHNIAVTWTDGPTLAQVKPILDRFVSKGFDGMTDCSYSCGKRLYAGCEVEVQGNYVTGTRSESPRFREVIARKLAAECGIGPVTITDNGRIEGPGTETRVPFNWYASYKDGGWAWAEFENADHILASDPTQGEWFSTLVWRVESCVAFEEQRPITVDLPEYIDLDANASTGRASFEEPQKMFQGHAALDDAKRIVETRLETGLIGSSEPAASVPGLVFHCRIGRSYPKITEVIQ